MKKTFIILGLLVGTTILLTANGRNGIEGFGRQENQREITNVDSNEKLRRNSVDPEDCTLEGDEVGTGYLNNDDRKFNNQNTSGRGRNRRN